MPKIDIFSVHDACRNFNANVPRIYADLPADDAEVAFRPDWHDGLTSTARQIMHGYDPRTTWQVKGLRAGEMSVCRVKSVKGDELCLKFPSPTDCELTDLKTAAECFAEWERATYAGTWGLGPKVYFNSISDGSFATAFAPGREPSMAEARSCWRPAIMQHVHRLHACTDPIPAYVAQDASWLMRRTLAEDLSLSEIDHDRATRQAFTQLECAVEHCLDAGVARVGPIHDDLHVGNILGEPSSVQLIDWNNLRLGDPMRDLGYFSAMTRALDSDLQNMLCDYHSNSSAVVEWVDNDLPRLRLQHALFQMRIYGHMIRVGCTPAADFIRMGVRESCEVLQGSLKELGLRVRL